MRLAHCLMLLGCVFVSVVSAKPLKLGPASKPALFVAENGEASADLNVTLLEQFGLKVIALDARGREVSASQQAKLRWQITGRYSFSAPGDAIESFDLASMRIDGGLKLRYDGRELRLRNLKLAPNPANTVEMSLSDSAGRVWFIATHAHHHAHGAKLELKNLDLRAGPALDSWLGVSTFAGAVLGSFNLESPLIERPSRDQIKSCAIPNWPNTPGAPGGGLWRADVLMEAMGSFQGGGCTGGCDGPGGAAVGLVKFTPSATLRNSNNPDTAEVPWYEMFTPAAPPYNNDQHPFLVWHVYRLNADGRFVQLARSGVKHAFYTVNTTCAESCNSNGRILGKGCGDVYGVGNNDTVSALGGRNEIVPALGIWGRCGSTRDPGPACTGIRTTPAIGSFGLRALASEGEIDPSQNAGAQYFFDGWYLVRDDVNIFNTMGSQGFRPAWTGSLWNGTALTPFIRGATIDRWVSPSNPAANSFSTLVASSDGHSKAAVRAVDLGNGRWRYNYAVMNFDFARATIAGTPPNTTVSDNRGFVAVAFGKSTAATVENVWFFDGDANSANNWTSTVSPGLIEFRRDSGNDMSWGAMFSFSFESNQAPSFGALELVAGRGKPDRLLNITLTPGGSEPALFTNAFD